jgi:UTP--glucose-1-phosphate uridylyltransferase
LIRNEKNVDPSDPTSPKVIQIETAMGAAIEVFSDSRTIEVGRDRFVPVKTTDDLLVLRSDAFDLGKDFVLEQVPETLPFIDLDGVYKVVEEFDKRFPAGVPSLKEAESLVIEGDWTFGERVKVKGSAKLKGDHGRVEAGTVLGEGSSSE